MEIFQRNPRPVEAEVSLVGNRPAPFRYGDGAGSTFLGNMRGRYSTLYLRCGFTLDNPEHISVLDFMIDYDDGFKVWVNSQEMLSVNVPTSLQFNCLASKTRESGEFETFETTNPTFLRKGVSLIAI